MADMKISDLPEAPDINDAQQFEVNDSGNSRRVTFQMLREKIKSLGDTWFAQKTHTHTANQISDTTLIGQTLMKAVDPVIARDAIGAGTSNLVLGTEEGMAKPGDWMPDLAAIPGGNPVFAQYTAGTNWIIGRLNDISAYATSGWLFPWEALRSTSTGTIRLTLEHRRECIIRKNGSNVAYWNAGNSLIWRDIDIYVDYGDIIQVGIYGPSNSKPLVRYIYTRTASIAPLMVYSQWIGEGSALAPPPPSNNGGGNGG